MQKLEVTHGKRGHGPSSVQAQIAVTPLLPVPLSETACNACIWLHLSGMELLASTLSHVRSFHVTWNLQPVLYYGLRFKGEVLAWDIRRLRTWNDGSNLLDWRSRSLTP